MIEFFSNNQYAAWFTIGFILLALEMLVLGFSTGFVLFIGVAALLTGTLNWMGVIPDNWTAGIACFGLSSVIISVLLYKPLKKLQDNNVVIAKDTSSDMIGLEFRLEQAISITHRGTKKYSGIEWQVEISKDANIETIPAGTLVRVVSVDVALFRVKPASD